MHECKNEVVCGRKEMLCPSSVFGGRGRRTISLLLDELAVLTSDPPTLCR